MPPESKNTIERKLDDLRQTISDCRGKIKSKDMIPHFEDAVDGILEKARKEIEGEVGFFNM